MKEFKAFEDMKSEIPESATHYFNETADDFFAWVKFNGDTAYMMMPHSNCFSSWTLCEREVILKNANKIPDKRTRTEYEKVIESIFDLRDEFERGGLYCKYEHAREYTQITNTQTLTQALHGGFCYRKVEKEIDWKFLLREAIEKEIDERQEFIERANGLVSKSHAVDYSLGKMYDAGCRFVGANGEIE